MRLIGLLFVIIGWILNLIYGIIMLPYTVTIHFKNRRWRKNPQVGDTCFYKNLLGTQTHCEIHDIDGDRVFIISRGGIGTSRQWTTTKGLRKY